MTASWARIGAIAAFGALLAVAAGAGLRAIAADAPANQVLPFGEINRERGYVKVSAIGLPPFGASGASSPEEVARQNAVGLAQKRLLGVLLDMPAKGRKVRDHLASRPDLKDRLRTLVSAAQIQGKSYSDGSVEITLTLPMEGPSGLKAFLAAI